MNATTTSSVICIRCIFIVTSLVLTLSQALPQPPNDTRSREGSQRDQRNILFNKKESCEAIPYSQDIKVHGCKTRTIENHYCKGNCISGYVPENGVNGKYKCSSCQPSKTMRRIVELECEGGSNKLVEVEIFVSCRCQQSNCHPQVVTGGASGRNASRTKEQQPSTSTEEEEEQYDPKRPCRYICRKCRKARREYDVLQTRKEKYEYLVNSCRTAECHKRISQEDVKGIAKVQKRLKKAVCKECKDCKNRKRQGLNA